MAPNQGNPDACRSAASSFSHSMHSITTFNVKSLPLRESMAVLSELYDLPCFVLRYKADSTFWPKEETCFRRTVSLESGTNSPPIIFSANTIFCEIFVWGCSLHERTAVVVQRFSRGLPAIPAVFFGMYAWSPPRKQLRRHLQCWTWRCQQKKH